MGKLNSANLKKTIYYLKRNGLRETFLAALERLRPNEQTAYVYLEPDAAVLQAQRERQWKKLVTFTILVPAYHTKEQYLREMIASVQVQTYGIWKLIIADASEDTSVSKIVEEYTDNRIVLLRLGANKGISENTNAALAKADGDYIVLLDHDDLLTPDALYEMAERIEEKYSDGKKALILYSDEDKCNQEGEEYYESNIKLGFNLDLILSNNYICHLLVMEIQLARETGFRKDYDGAQDYDFVLRAIAKAEREQIVHIPKVLYHWRCHAGSTAENPESKRYAYEAGGRAIESFVTEAGWHANVQPLKHLGFYRVDYEPDIFQTRRTVGAVGGKLYNRHNKITGGIYDSEGRCPYLGINKSYSGYMHRASLQQETEAVDIRLMRINPAARQVVEEVLGYPFQGMPNDKDRFDYRILPSDTDYREASSRLCRELKKRGFSIVWNPAWMERV